MLATRRNCSSKFCEAAGRVSASDVMQRDATASHTLGMKEMSVYLLVRTLLRSYPLGSVKGPSKLT